MKKTIILLTGLCFFQHACCMNKVPSSASISVLGDMAGVLFQNCNQNCLKTFQDIGINQSDGQLYINAFNVGQGNFIVLRKENRAVIIDAGGVPFDEEHIKIDELLVDVVIDAVFITHPHDDHFSLFNNKLFGAFPKSFANTVFYLSGKESDWKTGISQKFLRQLSILSPVISSVQYLDNEQHEVSLLNGVVFKTFYLDPPIRRDPNKLSLLLQISYMGKNVLFTGDAEGDSIARLFQTVGDLSSAANLVQNGNEVTEIVKLFNYYTAAYRDFVELRSLCSSLAVTLGNYIFDRPNIVVSSVQNLIDNLQTMIAIDQSLFNGQNVTSLQGFVNTITPLSQLTIDPFFYFCICHLTPHEKISSLGDLCNALNTMGDGSQELVEQLYQLGDLL
ncbi:MAG: MBL fold metallo-hydrolase, partial [Holosporaceae bacterium]|nr:MBL fold metallo-hydrolase [Holosporaceae bacterium]